jgi:hypothetical protein
MRGVLLYAKTDEEITPDNDYIMSGNIISVKTVKYFGGEITGNMRSITFIGEIH